MLNGGTTAPEKATVENLVIAEGRPHAGERVRSAASSQPWVGKGTPEQMRMRNEVAPAMLQEWSETKRAPQHAAWLRS